MANQERAIRDMFARFGLHISIKQVVEALSEHGVDVSESFVLSVKGKIVREQVKAERERAKRPPLSKFSRRPQQRKIPPQRG